MSSVTGFITALLIITFVVGMIVGAKTHKLWLKLFNKR